MVGVVAVVAVVVIALVWYLRRRGSRTLGPNWARDLVVVVTGASSGIGRQIALECAAGGAKCVVLAARRRDRIEDVARECSILSKATKVVPVVCDVTNFDDSKSMLEFAVQQCGGIDLLVLNAGVSMDYLFEDATKEGAEVIVNTNFWGPVWEMQLALPHLKKSHGRILVVSSASAHAHRKNRSFYSASKAAILSLCNNVRTEVKEYGVSITVGSPGFVQTEMTQGISRLDPSGKSLGGKVPYNSHGLKFITAQDCAKEMLAGCMHRKREVFSPSKYGWIALVVYLCPEFYEWKLNNT
ncbi:short chain dehydrogenase [Pelomyxa schiedti]|nr:short chain dehydrogenase [Pelomyxa schiedti]